MNLSAGDIFRIPDPTKGVCYYGVVGYGGDFLFYDFHDEGSASAEQIARQPIFIRLSVGHSSIKKARWIKVGSAVPAGEIARGTTRVTSGSPSMVIDTNFSGAASMRTATDEEAKTSELSAVWSAVNHLPFLLRYHFFGDSDTFTEALVEMLRQPIQRGPR